jgi:hypothetical protein
MNSGSHMRFKQPLTRADLVAIQERNPESADVRTLLWEVKRFRALALIRRPAAAHPGYPTRPTGRRVASHPRAA